jgi:hypothetical protein
MGKVWVLHTGTKGTGAQMVPLEKVLSEPKDERRFSPRKRRPPEARAAGSDRADLERARNASGPRRYEARPGDRHSGALPPDLVRKKATGEIGRVRSVDARSGTANVLWLKQGRASTVPLTSISRR